MRKIGYAALGLAFLPAAAFAQDGQLAVGAAVLNLADEARVATLESDVSALQTTVNDHESRITALEGSTFVEIAPEAGNVATRLWAGSQADFDAIGTKDANTVYVVVP